MRTDLLIIAIILIAIGAFLLYAPLPDPLGWIGQILLVAGVICFVVWLVLAIIGAVRHG